MNIWLVLAGGLLFGGGWLVAWLAIGRYLLKLQHYFTGLLVGGVLRRYRLDRPWQAWLGRRLGYEIADSTEVEAHLRRFPSNTSFGIGVLGSLVSAVGFLMLVEGFFGRSFFGLRIFS